jgi:hypothetical protein
MPSGQSIYRNKNNLEFILSVSKNVKESSCTTLKYFISINCLQMYYVKILLSHVIQLANNTPIILKLSLLHDLLNVAFHSNSMLGNEWKVLFGHNTSHFIRWNRYVCNAPPSPNYPRNLPSFVWSQHKCNSRNFQSSPHIVLC